ncbi:sulfite exporter TauE/SafE family protein [Mesorhizobium sp. 1M-11]|uniref:sulfite exporter TauE/SafE family protein n=1 Tax=Mesorhizobium sp. 1M-11 TaxID=1529006 RepID=UPI0006C74396|nr:sulfite exporter TauE/SafE family protein [Mesorhizobium sp. 1M-11]
MALDTVLASGLLTGLAGSLHCAGLCGGVASMLLTARQAGGAAVTTGARLSFLSRLQVGRAAVYVLAGGIAGSIGYYVQSLLFLAGLQDMLRYAASALIVVTGLSVANILPPLGRLDHGLRHAAWLWRALARLQPGSTVGLGAALALAPCAMVFNALLTAMLTGGPLAGAVYMAGFAVAALPGVVFSALGIATLAGVGRGISRGGRLPLGILLATTGVLFALLPGGSITQLCFG